MNLTETADIMIQVCSVSLHSKHSFPYTNDRIYEICLNPQNQLLILIL